MELDDLGWDAAGLVTVVVQDRHTGEVRMVAHADRAAVAETLETGCGTFYSRSRRRPWRKGETSGNTLSVREVWADCDGDALVYLVDPAGPSCHTGERACFFRPLGERVAERASPTLSRLADSLEHRRGATGDQSYTRHLLDGGPARVAAKVREEGEELARALEAEPDDRVVSEAADVLYHAMVGLLCRGLDLRDVEAELARRFGRSGHREKAERR